MFIVNRAEWPSATQRRYTPAKQSSVLGAAVGAPHGAGGRGSVGPNSVGTIAGRQTSDARSGSFEHGGGAALEHCGSASRGQHAYQREDCGCSGTAAKCPRRAPGAAAGAVVHDFLTAADVLPAEILRLSCSLRTSAETRSGTGSTLAEIRTTFGVQQSNYVPLAQTGIDSLADPQHLSTGVRHATARHHHRDSS